MVAFAGLLYLDHVGPQVAEKHRAVRPGQSMRQVEHPQTEQRLWAGIDGPVRLSPVRSLFPV